MNFWLHIANDPALSNLMFPFGILMVLVTVFLLCGGPLLQPSGDGYQAPMPIESSYSQSTPVRHVQHAHHHHGKAHHH